MSHVTYHYNVLPSKAGPAYRNSDLPLGTLETYRALPAAERPYTDYDFGIIAEIIQLAELRAQEEARKGKGSGEVTLQKLLKAYEVVLPRHGARPEEDIYYYRLLLKLSLDPDPDWWGKFRRESGQLGAKTYRKLTSPRVRSTAPTSPRARSPSPPRRPSSYSYMPPPPSSLPSRTSSISSLPMYQIPPPPSCPFSSPPTSPPRTTVGVNTDSSANYTISSAPPPPDLSIPARMTSPPPLPPPPPPASFHHYPADIVSSPPPGRQPYAPLVPPKLPQTSFSYNPALTYSTSLGGPVQPVPPPSTTLSRSALSSASTPGPFAYAPYVPPLTQPQYPQGYAPTPYSNNSLSQYPPGSIVAANLGGGGASAAKYPPPPPLMPNTDAYGAGAYGGDAYGGRSIKGAGPDRRQAMLQSISDAESLEDSESEAYQEFRSLATSFRNWRESAAESAEERMTREEAIENWRIAVAFWEVHTARRCLRQWAAHRYLVMELAVQFWQGANLRDSFNHWRKVASHLRTCGALSQDHSARKTLMKFWGAWRKYVDFAQNKEQAMFKAASFWLGRSLHVYFAAWQRYTEACIKNEEHAMEFYAHQGRHMIMVVWARAAKKLKRDRLAAEAIEQRVHSRICLSVLRTWHSRGHANQHQMACLDKAVRFWLNSTLRSSWGSWRGLIAWKREGEELAAKHAAKVLHYLLEDGMQAWMALHQKHAANRETLRFHASRTQGAKKLRVLVAWRNQSVRMGMDRQAFQDIADVEVARLKHGTTSRLRNTARQLQCLQCVERTIAAARAVRSLRGWRAVSRSKRLRRASREEALAIAQERRLSKLMMGWQGVAALAAEHERVVRGARTRAARKTSSEVLYALFAHVLKRRRKHSRLASAISHFREQRQGSVMAVLWKHMLRGRDKRKQLCLADEQRERMLLDRAFFGWMQIHVDLENKMARALMHWDHSNNVLKVMALKEWHRVAQMLAAKHDKVRLAVAHWLGGSMGKCFWTWREQAREGAELKAKMMVACRVLTKGAMSKAFNRWLDFALYKADINSKSLAYLSVLCGHRKADCFLMLRANAARKRRSRESRAMRCRNLKRTALRGWRARLEASYTLEEKLHLVFRKMLGDTQRDAWDAWREFMGSRRIEHDMAYKAAYFWFGSQLRAAFEKLRMNMIEQQEERAALQRVMYFWMNNRLRFAFDKLRENALDNQNAEQAAQKAMYFWFNSRLRVAFDTLRANTEHQAKKRESLEKVLYYWRSSRLGRAFDMLRRNAQSNRTMKALIIKHMGSVAKAVLVAWRAQAEKLARLKDIYGNLVHVTSERRMAMTWKAWKEWIAMKHKGELTNSKAAGYLRNALLGRAWNTWLEHHHFVQTATKVVNHMLNLCASRAFQGWREMVLLKKEAMVACTQIILRLQNRELSNGLAAFKYNVVWQHAKRRADDHFFQVKGRQCLLAWRLAVKIGLALELWMGNSLKYAFDTWVEVVQEKRRLSITQDTVAKRWRNIELLSAWNSWLAFVEHEQDSKARMNRALYFWTRKGQVACWQWWRALTLWRRDMRNVASAIGSKIYHRELNHSWNGWKEFMYLREAKKRAVACWYWRQLASAFRSWHDLTHRKVEGAAAALEIFTSIATRLASKTTSSIFQAWHAHTVQIRGLRVILQKILGRHMEFAFYGWSELARDLKHQRETAECIIRVTSSRPELGSFMVDIVRRWRLWPLSQAFYTWLTETEEHKHELEGAAKSLFAYTGSLMRKAFMAWVEAAMNQIHMRNKVAGALLGMSSLKLHRAFHFWVALARYLKYMKGAMGTISSRMALHSKRLAWDSWREHIEFMRVARNAMSKILSRKLLGYWNQWRSFAQGSLDDKQKMRAILLRIQNRVLASAFDSWRASTCVNARQRHVMQIVVNRAKNTTLSRALGKWLDFWQAKMRKTVADVHYYGKLMDDVWLGWREVVEEAAAMRGLEANWAIVCRRALECWRRFAVDKQRAHAFVGVMQGYTAIRALVNWRMQAKAGKTLRNAYLRRALQGWYERVLYVAQMRFKLQGAIQRMTSMGMARAFTSWLSVTQEQNLRRRIFVQKQRAVQEAIRIGDQIRSRRNTELLQTTLLAWHLQAGLFREVASRFGAIMKRGLSSAFRSWHDLVVDVRVANNRALQHFRLSWQYRFLFQWKAAAVKSREVTRANEELSEDHWFFRTAGKVLQAWLQEVDVGRARRQALDNVLRIAKQVERKELLSTAWESMRKLMDSRVSMMDAADLMSKSRRTRIKQEVFDVWHQYAQAMTSQLNPASPFVSPRTKHEDRRLIRRMAIMLGNTDVDMGSDNSEDLLRDIPETEHMESARKASKDRQAVLSVGRANRPSPRRRPPADDMDEEEGEEEVEGLQPQGTSPSELSFNRIGLQQVPATPTLRVGTPQAFAAATPPRSPAAATVPQPPSPSNLQLLQSQLQQQQFLHSQLQQQQMLPPTPSFYGAPSPVPFRGINAAAGGPQSAYGMSTPMPTNAPAAAALGGAFGATPGTVRSTAARGGVDPDTGLLRSSILERSVLRGGRLGGGSGLPVYGTPAGPGGEGKAGSESGSSI